ncbi:MAG TPA: hypothetical protein VKM94_09835 [Blastocatellia bacterium]|nr:hypothetical protein [Blastocatellia bacterium]
MKFDRTKKILMGVLITSVLLLGASQTNSYAQGRRFHNGRVIIVHRPFFGAGFYRPWPYYTYDPVAYQREQGYSDGLSRGKSDARHGKPNDPASHKHYSESEGINYREAFAQGYADGYASRG